MTDSLTDRERIGMAFEELRTKHHYFTPIAYAWEVCCMSCGLGQMAYEWEEDPKSNYRGYVWWHVQKDDAAFYGDEAGEIPDAVLAAMEDDDVDLENEYEFEAWMDNHDHHELMNSAEIEDRLYNHPNLVDTLYLHWDGDCKVIVDVLKKNGLDAEVPEEPDHQCISIFPKVSALTGDGN